MNKSERTAAAKNIPELKSTFKTQWCCFNCRQRVSAEVVKGTLTRDIPCPYCGVSPKKLQDNEKKEDE